MTKYQCFVKENIDYSKYGFKEENGQYRFWCSGLVRMTITNKYQLQFNQVMADVLKVFSEMLKDDIVYFQTKEDVKKHTIKLSDEELKVIQEMRNNRK